MNKYITLLLLLLMCTPLFSQAQNRSWITVAGFNPGSAVIPEEGKESLKKLVSEHDPNEKSIRIIGMSDTLSWKNKSFSESQSADTTLAYKRANNIAQFYRKLGWDAEVISIQNFIPQNRGHRGVQVQVVDKSVPRKTKDLVLKITTKTEGSEKSEERRISGEEIVKIWQKGKTAKQEIVINVPSKNIEVEKKSQFDWSFDIGLRTWTTKSSWDLLVPTLGLSLYRDKWALSVGGGFAPWKYPDSVGDRRDALVFGEITGWPESDLSLKTGLLMGWETFSESDNWTMKVITPFIGPSFSRKNFELSLTYSPAQISSLIKEPFWKPGVMVNIGIRIR